MPIRVSPFRPLLLAFLIAILAAPPAQAMIDRSQLSQELSEVRKKSGDSPKRWVEEARLLYPIAITSGSDEEKRKLLEEGRALSQKARQAEPRNPGAILYWTVHAGSIAEMDKNLAALKVIKEIEKALLDLKTIDPRFEHAAADRALGRLYQKAPNIISIGSSSKARRHLKQAYESSPDYPGNQLFYADLLLEQGDKLEARRIAQAALKGGKIDQFPVDAEGWRKLAQRILDKTQ